MTLRRLAEFFGRSPRPFRSPERYPTPHRSRVGDWVRGPDGLWDLKSYTRILREEAKRNTMSKRSEKVEAAGRLLAAEVEYLTAAGWKPTTRYDEGRSTADVRFEKQGHVRTQEEALREQKLADNWPNVKPDAPQVAGDLEEQDWTSFGYKFTNSSGYKGNGGKTRYKHEKHPVDITIHLDTATTEVLYRGTLRPWCMTFDSATPVTVLRDTLRLFEQHHMASLSTRPKFMEGSS